MPFHSCTAPQGCHRGREDRGFAWDHGLRDGSLCQLLAGHGCAQARP